MEKDIVTSSQPDTISNSYKETKMKIPIYQVDAFAGKRFTGNPAAVCILPKWLDDKTMQQIAEENNLAETAYIVANDDGSFQLRWFTPTFEIPLCGHATLASGFVLFQYGGFTGDTIKFHSKSGDLFVSREGEMMIMDFPAYTFESAELRQDMIKGIGGEPKEFYRAGINYYAVFGNETEVRSLNPDYGKILEIMKGTDIIGFVPTAGGEKYDFVSRYFGPEEGSGIQEDPVTGSIHSALIPFWSKRLGKTKLKAYQASSRGGELFCEYKEIEGNYRCIIGGYVQPYLVGEVEV